MVRIAKLTIPNVPRQSRDPIPRMKPDDFIPYMLVRGVFPALGVVVLAAMWRAGVFRPGFLERGPVRRLRLPRGMSAVGLLIAGFSAMVGSVPGAALCVGLLMAWPGTARRLGVVGRDALGAAGWGLVLFVPVGVVAFAFNGLAGNIGLVLGDPPPLVGHRLLEDLIADPTAAGFLSLVGLAVVAAPLLEEASYRAMGQTLLGDWVARRHRWALVLGVGAVFALAHWPVVTWHALPGLFVLGVGFGAAYERSGSFWMPVVMHAGFNAANIAIVLAVAV